MSAWTAMRALKCLGSACPWYLPIRDLPDQDTIMIDAAKHVFKSKADPNVIRLAKDLLRKT